MEEVKETIAAARAAVPLLVMHSIEKSYGGVHALRGASLEISAPGRVHTLVGENGSGKSTLLGILAGQLQPDRGRIELDGEQRSFSAPADAIKQGIAMVSQETAIAPDLSVAENVLLGRRMVRGSFGLSPARTRQRAEEVLGRLGLDLDPAMPVGRLRPDQQQMVEIARALSLEARLLILDEPTSALSDDEVARLFAAVSELKGWGVSVLFVSHRLDDLFEIADEVTVLRDGRTVHGGEMAAFDHDSLVETMVGETLAAKEVQARKPRRPAGTKIALRIQELSVPGVIEKVDLDVHRGEIVGVAGLSGAGRSELLEAIYGVLPSTGTIEVDGQRFTPTAPRDSIRAGLGYLPPDRKTQALTLTMGVRDNLNVVKTLERGRLRMVQPREEAATARALSDLLRIKAATLDVAVGNLSGGNQQKVALGRWLAIERKVILLDEPTRGVDVAAKWEIQSRLRALADEGLAFLVSSSENDELRDLCDRVLVLFRGRVVGSLKAEHATDTALARVAGGKG
jgi:ABC-type sugar transport system ATPase subunit